MPCITRSASSTRPIFSSQRGDSGSLRRICQTQSAPAPPIRYIGRQPSSGMISTLSKATTKPDDIEKNAIRPSAQPRRCGGTNSLTIE